MTLLGPRESPGGESKCHEWAEQRMTGCSEGVCSHKNPSFLSTTNMDFDVHFMFSSRWRPRKEGVDPRTKAH